MQKQRVVVRAGLAGAAVLGACMERGDTGSLGTFEIQAEMTANSCGAQAVPLDAHFMFAAELLVNQGILRWRPVGAQEGAGTYDTGTGAFRVELNQSFVVQQPDVRHGITGCELARTDVIAGAMDLTGAGSGSDAGGDRRMSFQGTESIAFGPTTGSDCTGLLGARDGQFTTLPCTVAYGIQGTAR